MRTYARIFVALGTWAVTGSLCVGALIAGGYLYVGPSLPLAEELRDVRVQIPLSVYSRDGRLISQFGEKRSPVPYEDIPPVMVQAVLAAEDDRFFEHPGIDYQGTLRAMTYFILNTGDSRQGGSTITQQIARQYFLTRDRTLVRKFKEWILALRIEREFSKTEILDIFLNTTFFGQHAWGVAAAAQTYFGKDLRDISISDAAVIAGIPQGPSIHNPIVNPEAATQRRTYVLRRMRELDFITAADHEAAYVAGLKVTTTIDARLQRAADKALRQTLIEYDERHGYRGPLARVDLELSPEVEVPGVPGAIAPGRQEALTVANEPLPESSPQEAEWQAVLEGYAPVSGFLTGLVVRVEEILSTQEQLAVLSAEMHTEFPGEAPLVDPAEEEEESPAPIFQAQLYFNELGLVPVGLDTVAWALPYIDENRRGRVPQTVADVLQVGDVARFRLLQSGELRLGQVPAVQGALVSLDPIDGAVSALSGGFDFFLSNYNRAIQSQRQPGSAFKPFVYSAALERGFTAASIFNDAPIVQRSQALEGVWRPENYSGRFNGPTRLREALIKSLNLVSIRVIERSGVRHTVEHVRGFGFDETASPMNSTLALGSGGVAPLDLVQGYAVFANGGYRVDPYIIERIEGADGEVLYAASPELACLDCVESGEAEPKLIHGSTDLYAGTRHAPRAISAQNAYLMNDMMQDVVRRGTGVRAYRELGRTDLRGKTGTTNDQRDAWFAGFNGDVVTAAWVGFDQERSLGDGEQGARTALPMWISYMSEALDGMPLHAMERPPGIVDVRINPNTGLVASTRDSSIFEKFRMDYVPESEPTRLELPQDPVKGEFLESDRTETTVPGSIF